MNDETFQRLSRIDEQLIELCNWLNEKHDVATVSKLIPIMDDLTSLLAELSVKKR